MADYLILEDDPLVIKILRHLISLNEGDTLKSASSRQELTDILDAAPAITAALADLDVPDAPNGEAVDDLLQAGVPTLILTSNNDEKMRSRWLSKGAVDYVTKDGRYWYPYAVRMLRQLHLNRQRKILLIEDSAVSMMEMRTILELHQYSVLEAYSSEEALEILAVTPDIHLMVVDHQLPGMNGLELVQTIRYQFPDQLLAIIGVSGVEGCRTQLTLDFIRSGADDFLAKPFNLQEFIYRVNNNTQTIDAHVQLRDQAEKDFLTDLYNRRHFITHSKCIVDQAEISPVSLATLDIDFFKKVNDNFGHHAGDLVLQAVAEAMKNPLKPLLIARTGGEEFSILMPGRNSQEAFQLMDALRQRIADLKIDVEDGDILSVTVSIGICTAEHSDLSSLMNSADEALYRAKLNGRNEVVAVSQ